MLPALGAGDLSSNLSDPTMSSTNKTILFDLMGVVFAKGSFAHALHEMFPKVSSKLIKRKAHLYKIGKINTIQFWKGISDNPIDDEEKFLGSYRLDPFFPKIVDRFRKKYNVALVSNISQRWQEKFEHKYNIERHFDKVVYSYQLGIEKPDARIYLVALKVMNSDPAETIFIDDHLKNL